VASYLGSTTDLALKHRLAHELTTLGAGLPAAIAAADADWSAQRSTDARRDDRGEDDDRDGGRRVERSGGESAYDGELAAIYVLPLTAQGTLDPQGSAPASPFQPDGAAVAAAQRGGDLRTALVAGAPVRLLTYPTGLADGPAVLQVGRPLADQQRLLARLTAGLLTLGGAAALVLGAGSWWLAGRSIAPVERAWEQQRRFVANASHELRAPLTLLRATAEVALRRVPVEDTDQRALLGDALGVCDHMARLVEDLLLLSRLEAGRPALAREDVALGPLLAEVARAAGRLAEERGVRLDVERAVGTVRADRTRLRQVLLILLDNALGHTPTGGRVRLDAAPAGRRVRLVVEDTGAGIAPADLPRVFEPFHRSEQTRADGRDGCGLGLAIARALIEAHDGTIALSSQPGRGTRAEVVLPGYAESVAA
jgi:signal transduction histidine kinase